MELPVRKPLRWSEFNYSGEGAYFITICCERRKKRFGDIKNGFMCLNSTGKIAFEVWESLTLKFDKLSIGEFQIMPDHMHGLLIFEEDCHLKLSKVVGSYKSEVSHHCLGLFKQHNLKMGKLWQRGFYDHLIRNHRDYENATAYIRNNPASW